MMNSGLIGRLFNGARIMLKSVFSNPYSKLGLSWFKVKQIKHQLPGKERIISLLGHDFSYTSPKELIHGLKEIFVDKIYEQQLGTNTYILDCGANIGLSIMFLKSIAPDAVIEAFEPDPVNFALLKKNIVAFGLNQVILHQKAIWKEDTILQFESDGLMSSRIGFSEEAPGKSLVDVEAVSLKNFLNRPVDFLKIDIEGAEYEVVKDIQGSLDNVKSVFIEYHGKFAQNTELLSVLDIMVRSGFQFYIKEATSVYDCPLTLKKRFPSDWDVQLNIFFTRK